MPVEQVWVTVEGAVGFGAIRRTLYWQVANQKIPSRRRAVDNAIEVLAAALPSLVQMRLAEHIAQREAERAQEVEQLFNAPDVAKRLGHLPAKVAAAIRREAMRRYELLLAYEAVQPKTIEVAGERRPAPELAPIIVSWPATDRVVLQARPSWGEHGSLRTLRRLARAVAAEGVVALLPSTTAPVRADDRRLRASDPELEAAALTLRLRMKSATVQSLYRKLADKYGDRVPSIWSVRKLLTEQLPKAVEVYANQGPRTYRSKIEPPILRSYDQLDVGELLCGDHHQFDLECINPERGGRLDRPWVTMWLDLKSRAPMGWNINFQPNSSTIRDAFLHAVQPKSEPAFEQLWGLPTGVYIDNGKDYRSKFLEGADELKREGVFNLLGVRVTHAIPYNAKAKAVERFFKTLVDQFSRDQATYCGRNPMERTEHYRGLVAQHERWVTEKRGTTPFMTKAELERRFLAWVIEYMGRAHAALEEHDTGRELAPGDVVAARAQAPRKANAETLAYVCMPCERRVVRKGQVRWGRFYYQAPETELLEWEGREVDCRLDTGNVKRLLVSEPGGKSIVWCYSVELVEMTTERIPAKAITAIERQRRQERKVRELAREIEQRDLDGRTLEEQVIAALPREPEPPPAPTPPAGASVTAMMPHLDRAARAAAALGARAPELSPAELPPLRRIAGDAGVLDDRAYAESVLGPRRADPARWADAGERRAAAAEQAEWDRLAAQLIAERPDAARAAGGNK